MSFPWRAVMSFPWRPAMSFPWRAVMSFPWIPVIIAAHYFLIISISRVDHTRHSEYLFCAMML